MGVLDKALRDRGLTLSHAGWPLAPSIVARRRAGAPGQRPALAQLLEAYDKQIDVRDMPDFLLKLQRSGEPVERVAWSRALELAARRRDGATARRLGALMIQSGHEYVEVDYVSHMHVAAGDWQIVKGYLKEMGHRKVRKGPATYAAVLRAVRHLRALTAAERYDLAERYYAVAEKELAADELGALAPRMIALAPTAAVAERWVAALSSDEARSLDVLRARLMFHRAVGDAAGALEVVAIYTKQGLPPRPVEWAMAMAAARSVSDAEDVWEAMAASHRAHGEDAIHPSCYSGYIYACGADVEKAEAKFAAALRRNLQTAPAPWHALLACYHRNGLADKYDVALARMRLFKIAPKAGTERMREELRAREGPRAAAPPAASPLAAAWKAAACEAFEDTMWKHGTAAAPSEPVVEVL